MEQASLMELDFSGSTTTRRSTMGEDAYIDMGQYWNNNNNNWYSPTLLDWEALSAGPDDVDDDDYYFRGLIDYSSFMIPAAGEDREEEAAAPEVTAPPEEEEEEEEEMIINIMEEDHADYWPVVDAAAVAPEPEKAAEEEEEEDVKKGLRVVHLLVAAAEAVTTSGAKELARVILVRLKELVSPTGSTNMERLAAHFTDALQALLLHDAAVAPPPPPPPPPPHHQLNEDAVAAFQLLQDMSPYVKFGHFTANQAILEAVAHDRRVHIVDYDIMEGVQWASLMQALASRKDAPHLRITALTRPPAAAAGGGSGRKSSSSAQETGRRLAAFAASIGQPFSFHQCRLDQDENFRPAAVKMVKGEALVFNCMLHLPRSSHRSPDSVATFLAAAAAAKGGPHPPRLVTLVEEDTSDTAQLGFVGRFLDSLHRYSALYDSLEAGFPMHGRARALVERVFLGPTIAASVARSYRTRPGDGSWPDWMTRSGFRPVRISCFNHCQAKLLLGLFNDGYRLEEVGPNTLVLGWKSRRLLSASVWAPPSTPTTSSSHTTTPSSSC